MTTLKSANVTKYDNGGSGDNVISDGYIKSVEKVWIDTYTITAAMLSTSSLCLGYVPAGKKLIDVTVHLPAMNTEVATLGSVYLGTGATVAAGVLGVMKANHTPNDTYIMTSAQTLRLAPSMQDASHMKSGADTGIYMTVWLMGELTAVTSGEIKSIIKYT